MGQSVLPNITRFCGPGATINGGFCDQVIASKQGVFAACLLHITLKMA